MKVHANARLTPYARRLLVDRICQKGEPVAAVAATLGISERTAYKWLRRDRDGESLADRSSRPHRQPSRTPERTTRRIVKLRCRRLVGWEIAATLGVSRATVTRILKRHGLARIGDLERKPPIIRYERERPGELLHMDTKKLARFEAPGHRIHGNRSRHSDGAGYEFLHSIVDDCTRLAYNEVLPNERKETVLGFVERARDYYESQGIEIERLMTDNGSAYRSKLLNRYLDAADIRHIYTRPYTPRTNGKVERFIQTASRRWAYGVAYEHSNLRRDALPAWTDHYNHHRPHQGLSGLTPAQRLRERTEQPHES